MAGGMSIAETQTFVSTTARKALRPNFGDGRVDLRGQVRLCDLFRNPGTNLRKSRLPLFDSLLRRECARMSFRADFISNTFDLEA